MLYQYRRCSVYWLHGYKSTNTDAAAAQGKSGAQTPRTGAQTPRTDAVAAMQEAGGLGVPVGKFDVYKYLDIARYRAVMRDMCVCVCAS